jgi:hypothetical protein
MNDATKAFLEKCALAKESIAQTEPSPEGYGSPDVMKLSVEEVLATGAESTTVAAVQIGVSAVSA